MSRTAHFDPVLVEVIGQELAAIGEEMAVVTWRTGRSPMLKSGDFATAICNADGQILVRGFAATFQLAVFSDLIVHLRAKYGDAIKPGDAFLSNDPAHSTTHLPDVATATPVFCDGQLVAFCAVYSHHSDIGGRFSGGSSAEPTSSFEEGLLIPSVKVVDQGETNAELLDLIAANVRAPKEWRADLQSKLAGCRRGREGMEALLARYGARALRSAGEHLLQRSERVARAVIAAVPDGRYEVEHSVRDETVAPPGEIVLRLALTVDGDEFHADFTGSSGQVDGALNMPVLMTRAAVYGAVKCVLAPHEQANSGFFAPIDVQAPGGTIVNPLPGAAVGGRASVFFWTYDLVLKGLAQAVPELVGVPGEATDMMHFTGRDREGDPGAVLDIYCGGWGARADRDGVDGVAPLWYEIFGTIPAEIIERQYPIVVEGFGFEPDTGGAGRYRGSVAVFRRWRFLEEGEVMVRTVRLTQEDGFAGGRAGAPARTSLHRGDEITDLPLRSTLQQQVRKGDVLYHATAGAGGHGDPHERPVELVAGDLITGLVSAERAADLYAVALGADGLIDPELTDALRDRARKEVPR